jgi:cytoskeletal protein CcmA (bactofilin family)
VTSNVAVSQIANGTSILSVNGSGGNILVTVGGVSNVAQFVSYGLEVTGNVNSANIYLTGRFVSAGNVTGANLLATNNVVATGNVKGTHVNSDLTMSAVGNIQGGNLRTAGTVSATGNVAGNYFIGNGSQLTDITSSYGNSNVGVYLAAYSGNITANIISATGNVTGGNLLTAGAVSTTGNVFGTIVSATGNVNAANIYLTGQQVVVGNITGGNLTATTDMSVSGNVKAGGVTSYSFISATGNATVGNISATNHTGATVSVTGNVTGTYFVGTATSAQYADVAENYTSDNNYEPGTVLEFGGSAEVTIASDETPRVAGVVSTLPAHLMNSMLIGEHTVALALLGRVPCKVQGPISKGDMLISAGGGYARAKQNPIMGTVIGKALEALPGDHGVIEVVVGRL